MKIFQEIGFKFKRGFKIQGRDLDKKTNFKNVLYPKNKEFPQDFFLLKDQIKKVD